MIRLTKIKYVVLLSYLVTTTNSYKSIVLEITPDSDDESNEDLKEVDDFISNVKPVVRVVPSSYKTPPIEYDKDTQTIFVPQHRINKKKMFQQSLKENTLDAILKQPFSKFSKDGKKKQNLQSLVQSVNSLLKVLRHPETKDTLRHSDPYSHEEKDPEFWGSGRNKTYNFPHYSIWNYWTYDKQLLVDQCPKGQIKVGNVCIWSPNHRD